MTATETETQTITPTVGVRASPFPTYTPTPILTPISMPQASVMQFSGPLPPVDIHLFATPATLSAVYNTALPIPNVRYVIHLAAGVYSISSTVQVPFRLNIVLTGGSNTVIFEPSPSFPSFRCCRFMEIGSGGQALLHRVTLRGFSGGSGSVINNFHGVLLLNEVIIENNTTTVDGIVWAAGSPMFPTDGRVSVWNSTFRFNTSQQNGGAIAAYTNSEIDVICTTFEQNQSNFGGAIGALPGSRVIITNSNFIGNRSTGVPTAGAIYNSSAFPLVAAQNNFWGSVPPPVSGLDSADDTRIDRTNYRSSRYSWESSPCPVPQEAQVPALLIPTPTPSPAPTSTPFVIRNVEPQAQSFHANAARFGLPLPFDLWPVRETDDFQNSYGPNWFTTSQNAQCNLPPPIQPTADPNILPTPTRIPDKCPYRFVNRIHPGVDYYTDPRVSVVVALCNGIITAGATDAGGSAGSNTGAGLSLRCFADDPNDPDGDGFRNLSNIMVVYNHLTLNQGVDKGMPGETFRIVRKDEVLAITTSYASVEAHLDLQIYIGNGYRSQQSIQLNPRLMNTAVREDIEGVQRIELEQSTYPLPYSVWSLYGRLEGSGNGAISFWNNPNSPTFIYDIVGYLNTIYPTGYTYQGPNCNNLPANVTMFGINTSYPECVVESEENDISDVPGQGR